MPRKKIIPKVRSKKTNSEVQKGLMDIYSNSDGSLPDISHLEVKKGSYLRFLFLSIFGIMILMGAIAALGFLLFTGDNTSDGDSVEITISSEKEVASGDRVRYEIEYKNLESVPLNEVEVLVRFPEGFHFERSEPAASNEFNTSWNGGTLEAGETGRLVVEGKLIGQVGSVKTVNVTVSFQPQNFSSTFKESESFNTQITSSIISLEVEGPERVQPDKEAVYTVSYRNNAQEKLENVKVVVKYPKGFAFKDSSPKPRAPENAERALNNEWLIDALDPGEDGQIKITGGFVNGESDVHSELLFQIGFVDGESGEFSLQQESRVITEVLDPNLSGSLIINGSAQDQPISFGQRMTYSIVYKNLGNRDLEDVEITIQINGDIVDWSSLDDKNKGTKDGTRITWTKDEVSGLANIRALSEGTIDFTVKVKEADEVNTEEGSLQVLSKVSAKIGKIAGEAVEDLTIDLAELKNNINTDVQFDVEGRYFDDDNIAVGSGPLPPVVGEKTTFRLYWKLSNSVHPISDVTVTTVLPGGVRWAGKSLVDDGVLDYDPDGNTVTWEIDRVSDNQAQLVAWFDISVTPTKDQVKQLLILSDQTTLSATDVVTEEQVRKTDKAVTSNLEDDPIGGGKGLVVELKE